MNIYREAKNAVDEYTDSIIFYLSECNNPNAMANALIQNYSKLVRTILRELLDDEEV